MSKTLLQAVNELLKRVGQIHGDSAALASLTQPSRQRSIDVAIQVINEGIDELYTTSKCAAPNEQGEGTITLATGDRSYALAEDLVQLRWPFIDKTNNQYLRPFAGGYDAMLLLDPEQDDTGLPHFAAINPVNGELHLDRAPTAAEAGRVYTYQYDKELALSAATDLVPFGNIVFRAMVPAWVQLWRRDMQNEFDAGLFAASIGRASRVLSKEQPRIDYCPR